MRRRKYINMALLNTGTQNLPKFVAANRRKSLQITEAVLNFQQK